MNLHHRQRQLVLISTYWNVNTKVHELFVKLILVLISTYWNVNLNDIIEYDVSDSVLISTYWNVNANYWVDVVDYNNKF